MLFDSDCSPPSHAAALLHPPVAPPCGNQESPHVLLSPSKTGVAYSSLLPETPLIVICFSSTARLLSLMRPIKGVKSLTIHHSIYFSLSFGFLLHKNSLLSELKSPPPPLLTVWPHPSLHHPELQLVRSLESPSSSPSIHGELSCITPPHARTPMSSCCHRSTDQPQSTILATGPHIFHTKINQNSSKNHRILHQHPCLF
jgi:hypothetical protein